MKALKVDFIPFKSLSDKEQALVNTASNDKALTVASHDYMRAQVICDVSISSYFLRHRFSGGHECGHLWLEHTESDPNREEEANYFSGYLLVPHPILLSSPKLITANDVSIAFGVSTDCAAIALRQANLRKGKDKPLLPHERWLIEHIELTGDGSIART